MYCPSCGLQQTQELRYCPRCGANLNPVAEKEASPNLVGPIWAVSMATTLVTLLGLGLVFAFIMVLVTRDISIGGSVMLIVAFFLLVVMVVASLLVTQLSRLLNLYRKPAGKEMREKGGTGELGGRTVRQLEAVPEQPPDITENTTRTFDAVPRERQTKPR
jgi:CBS domain containing-hemolysin-like protein